ncbi:hypothetical protein FB45DRAFT_122875 [Roridomyces roridus]|uniref:Uncharacterized protein n=1 Tax=Roridomyces roridus TaxID=1738132 RepID=A0AAD7FIE2_9AGAR|nr:hypothetical protein FB45DRAFT_122875 [Roridomyces roridus]
MTTRGPNQRHTPRPRVRQLTRCHIAERGAQMRSPRMRNSTSSNSIWCSKRTAETDAETLSTPTRMIGVLPKRQSRGVLLGLTMAGPTSLASSNGSGRLQRRKRIVPRRRFGLPSPRHQSQTTTCSPTSPITHRKSLRVDVFSPTPRRYDVPARFSRRWICVKGSRQFVVRDGEESFAEVLRVLRAL